MEEMFNMTDLTIDETCYISCHNLELDIYTNLLCTPIQWSERQDSDPAVREEPMADSQYLDSDTYVLKPRELEFTIRLSDSEKKTMDTIFNYSTNVYSYVDLFLFHTVTLSRGWHYTVWIRDKTIDFDWVIQNGRLIRWWTVKIVCDVKTFLYEQPILTVYGTEGRVRLDGGTWHTMSGEWMNYVDIGDHTLEFDGSGGCSPITLDSWTAMNGCIIDSGHESDNPVTIHVVGFANVTYTVTPLSDFQIGLSSNIDNPCWTAAYITVGGTKYSSPSTVYEYFGAYSTSAAAQDGDDEHVFDHWVTTGGVSVDDAYSNPCTITVIENGTLEAIFHSVTETWNSSHPCDANQGQMCVDGSCALEDAWQNLPVGPFGGALGTYYIYWRPHGNGGTFVSWSTTGGLTVAHPDENSLTNTVTVTDSGTLTVHYTKTGSPEIKKKTITITKVGS